MAELALSNVISVSVSAAPAGVGKYNTSNLALFTRETPGEDFGDDGFKIYKSPSEVAKDFGTSSQTAQMATGVFSQAPNILTGGGYLVVIPFLDTGDITAVQGIAFSHTPASGGFKLNWEGDVTGSIAWNATNGDVQTAVRTLAGLESATVTGSFGAGFVVTFTGVTGAAALLTVTLNSLQSATPEDIVVTVSTTTPGSIESTEDLDAAITRTKDLVQYFGIIDDEILGHDDLLAAAAVVQALNKILFACSKTAADVDSGGLLDLLRTGSFDKSRGLLYIGTGVSLDAILFAARYAGRALSTDFGGSNTTQTMHLKDLVGQQPDAGMNQTILEKCKTAGADVYVSLQGVPKVFCTGGNKFFDQVYNRLWFVGAIEVAGFNALAESSTKLPQTEQGMSVLKAAYRTVCQQGVANGYFAPGTWTSADTFGNLGDFIRNIGELGFYIYSSPISAQLAAAREAREAPLAQIAGKEAGAIQSENVIVYINA